MLASSGLGMLKCSIPVISHRIGVATLLAFEQKVPEYNKGALLSYRISVPFKKTTQVFSYLFYRVSKAYVMSKVRPVVSEAGCCTPTSEGLQSKGQRRSASWPGLLGSSKLLGN